MEGVEAHFLCWHVGNHSQADIVGSEDLALHRSRDQVGNTVVEPAEELEVAEADDTYEMV